MQRVGNLAASCATICTCRPRRPLVKCTALRATFFLYSCPGEPTTSYFELFLVKNIPRTSCSKTHDYLRTLIRIKQKRIAFDIQRECSTKGWHNSPKLFLSYTFSSANGGFLRRLRTSGWGGLPYDELRLNKMKRMP